MAIQRSVVQNTGIPIICGDVLRELERLPATSPFDVIIADPPYNIGKDFGLASDSLPLADYIDWTEKWLWHCQRLLADKGLIYVYGFPEILARIAACYPVEEQRWLAWHYTNKTVPSATFWQRSHESILCLWKSEQPRPALEIDQIREAYTECYLRVAGNTRRGTPSRFGGTRGRKTIYKAHAKGALPRDVLKVPALAGGAGAAERWFMCHDCDDAVFPPEQLKRHRAHQVMKHPTQKPMKLTERLIQSRINGKGGRVLIPFVGSGSECIVAESLELDWLGIEINPRYADFAKKWMQLWKERYTASPRG